MAGTAALVAPVGSAKAQVAVSASVVSDYRFRGLSLSDGRPTFSLTVNYDHPSGAYAGVSGLATATAHDGLKATGYQAFVGYAGRLKSGASWDVGASRYDVTDYLDSRYRIQYEEVYAGITAHNVSAHIYYSPNYLGEGIKALYFDASTAFVPAPTWRLFAHAGVLAPLNPPPDAEMRNVQVDLRAGVAKRFKACEVELAWTHYGPSAEYPGGYPQSRDALVAGATYHF